MNQYHCFVTPIASCRGDVGTVSPKAATSTSPNLFFSPAFGRAEAHFCWRPPTPTSPSHSSFLVFNNSRVTSATDTHCGKSTPTRGSRRTSSTRGECVHNSTQSGCGPPWFPRAPTFQLHERSPKVDHTRLQSFKKKNSQVSSALPIFFLLFSSSPGSRRSRLRLRLTWTPAARGLRTSFTRRSLSCSKSSSRAARPPRSDAPRWRHAPAR